MNANTCALCVCVIVGHQVALRLRNFVTLTVFPKLLTLFEIGAFDYLKVCLHIYFYRPLYAHMCMLRVVICTRDCGII